MSVVPASRERGSRLLAPVTPLLGRERELAAIRNLVQRDDVRQVTITGPGGIGKTRLAMAFAWEFYDNSPERICFVALASLRDHRLVAGEIAGAVGLPDIEGHPAAENLIDAFQKRDLLLVLDNFEHLMGAAPFVAELLATCPRLKLLVTSRTVLRLQAEHTFVVPPLAVPDSSTASDLKHLQQFTAVQLFVSRARVANPDIVLSDEHGPMIAAICRRLDGLPLAIELAATRVRALSFPALLARLESRLTLLTGGARDLPARQQSLRDTIAWSYDLLAPAEQALFRRLSIFVGGCTLQAAEAVAALTDNPSIDVLDAMTALVDQSLIRRESGEAGEPRFRMLETIREYAHDQLDVYGETNATALRAVQHLLDLAERAHGELAGPRQREWFRRLAEELDNLRSAMDWCLVQTTAESGIGLRLATLLLQFWMAQGHLDEGRQWFERGLSALPSAPLALRAAALLAAGTLTNMLGRPAVARAQLDQSLQGYRELEDSRGIAAVLAELGRVIGDQGDLPAAAALLEESLIRWRAIGDMLGTARALLNLGRVAQFQEGFARAVTLYEEALVLYRALGNARGIADLLLDLGIVAQIQGDSARAVAVLEESLAVYREIDSQVGMGAVLAVLGLQLAMRGDLPRSELALSEGLTLSSRTEDRPIVAVCLEGLAALAALQGGPERAARLFGATEALRERIGMPIPAPYRAAYTLLVATIRSAMGEAGMLTAWTAGRALPVDQVVAEALAGAAPAPSFTVTESAAPAAPAGAVPEGRSPGRGTSQLTPREQEIAILIARGLSNREIAGALVISKRTADTHITNILNRLGFDSRAQVAAWAAEQGLLSAE